MPVTKIGLNLSNIPTNLTAPDFGFKNTTQEFIDDIPAKANSVTEGWFGSIVLWGVWFWLFWKLAQQDFHGGDYGYSQTRSAGIASAICSVIGIYAINFGYFVNFYHVTIFVALTFIITGVVWKSQR